jgi:DMSO/TMAO reductase YedYZ heme-binding membrane subunit
VTERSDILSPPRFEGTAVVGWSSLALVGMTAFLLAIYGTHEEGVRVVVRATARTSLIYFAAAFAASGLRRLWRAPLSAWLLRNRRYIGLSFAVSHAIHLGAILTLAATVPGFAANVSRVTAIGGGFGYVLIAGMVLTSNDTTVRRLGRRRWRALHLLGMWVVFGIFVSSYLGRALHNPNYVPHAALLAAALTVRLWPARGRILAE